MAITGFWGLRGIEGFIWVKLSRAEAPITGSSW